MMAFSAVFAFSLYNIPVLSATVVSLLFCGLLYVARLRRQLHGTNPFSPNYVRPPGPIVVDSAVRKAVLKQKFTADKVPENLDAIVIGSGIGGLSVAVLLSRVGKRVLVLEQHDQAGGCCHSFTDKGYEFDTGIHYIGNMQKGSNWQVLVDQLSSGQIVWCPMDKVFDRIALGDPSNPRWFDITYPKEEFITNLVKEFPKERAAIERFMTLSSEASVAAEAAGIFKFLPQWLTQTLLYTGLAKLFFPGFFKFNSLNLREALDKLTDNTELKAVFAYLFVCYGVPPKNASFIINSEVILHYTKAGAFYPRGGTSELAFNIIPNIEKAGGKVLMKAAVSKILMDGGGRAHGVRVKRKDTEVDIFAPIVISDAGATNTFTKLLPPEIAKRTSTLPVTKKLSPKFAAFSVFLGLKGTSAELGLKASNVFMFSSPDFDKLCEDVLSVSAGNASDADVPVIYASFPSAKDPTWESRFPGKSVALLITFTPYHWFEKWENTKVKHRGQDYLDLKTKIGQRILEQFLKLFPHLEDKVDYFDTGTPLSSNYYMGVQKGEAYGLDHTTERYHSDTASRLRPVTEIPGLYLTGQDVAVCGFVGALAGGTLCASKILGRNLFSDLSRLQRQV